MMEMLIKNNKGITLIALVITIIVLLILAAVSIAMLTGNNGILSQAGRAKENTEQATGDEENKLNDMNSLIEKMTGGEAVDDETQKKNQQETIDSIQTIDEGTLVFYMDYTADYKFDKFLQTGADDEDSMVDFVSQNLLDGQKIDFNFDAQIACSTFAAKTQDGATLFGRNLDLPYSYASPALIVRTSAGNGRYASLSIADGEVLDAFKSFGDQKTEEEMRQLLIAPYIPFDGINSAGVSMGVLALNNIPTNQSDSAKKGITTTTAIRLVLDKAGSVDEAVQLLKQYNMHMEGNDYHFQIADASGKSVVVEYIDNQMQVIEQDYNACTNFYIYHYLRGEQDMAVYDSKDRYNNMITSLSNKNGIVTEDEAMGILQSVSNNTKWSVVYNSKDLTMNLAPKSNYDESTRVKFSLKE